MRRHRPGQRRLRQRLGQRGLCKLLLPCFPFPRKNVAVPARSPWWRMGFCSSSRCLALPWVRTWSRAVQTSCCKAGTGPAAWHRWSTSQTPRSPTRTIGFPKCSSPQRSENWYRARLRPLPVGDALWTMMLHCLLLLTMMPILLYKAPSMTPRRAGTSLTGLVPLARLTQWSPSPLQHTPTRSRGASTAQSSAPSRTPATQCTRRRSASRRGATR